MHLMQWLILQMWISRCEKPLHHWSNALKSSFAKNWNRVTVKFWSQYLQYLQSYLEIFIHHLAAAVPLLEIDYISPVYLYTIEIWPVLMACTWKNRVLLAVFWDKISMFHLGQTKHCSARCDGPLCALHSALISIISFWPLGNENSLFCTTEWLYIHVKTAFFPLSVWQIVQGGWKLRSRPRFDSWQFAGQAEKWRSAEIANFENLRFFYNLKFLIQF